MNESPRLLARIHAVLEGYPRLPEGIGAGFFLHMTPEVALRSYHTSLTLARERREDNVCEAINARIRIAEKHISWRIYPSPLTHVNSHGDFTVNQILCDNDRITGLIDWTSACVHSVVWELTGSYFYASPDCTDGRWSEAGLRAYISAYDAVRPLTQTTERRSLTSTCISFSSAITTRSTSMHPLTKLANSASRPTSPQAFCVMHLIKQKSAKPHEIMQISHFCP